jgi:hypothetical protein
MIGTRIKRIAVLNIALCSGASPILFLALMGAPFAMNKSNIS